MSAERPIILLTRWLRRVRESQFAHYAAEERLGRLHYGLGIPAAILSAIVGTTVFISLDSNEHLDSRLRIAIGCISILTAILTGCQTFLRFSERGDKHRSAATKFSALRREIEERLSFPDAVTPDHVRRIRERLNQIVAAAPNVPAELWARAVKRADSDYLWKDPDVGHAAHERVD